jgi:prepilin-type N-terminal cleavage/methylation domain-containing protein
MTMPHRRAFTMLEMLIALALMATFMVAVMECLISLQRYADLDERTYDLDVEGKLLLTQLSNDFANAAWFQEVDADGNWNLIYPQITKGAADSTWGDEIVFMKLRTERLTADQPESIKTEHVNFDSDEDKPARMGDYAKAQPIYSLILNPDYQAGQPDFVSPSWEAAKTGLSYKENLDKENLRQYSYQVRADPVTGRGILVRAYRTGTTEPWLVDRELGGNVTRLTIDTFKTRKNLNPNQIHISIQLLRDNQIEGQARTQRTVEATFALRSTTSDVTK